MLLLALAASVLAADGGWDFRVEHVTCVPCSLEVSVAALVTDATKDCGTGNVDCALNAAAAKKPFKATFNVAGMDSALTVVFVGGSDGRIRQLSYDSDTGGGLNFCLAAVFASECRGLKPSPRGAPECASEKQLPPLCLEDSTRRLSYSAPKPLAELGCEEAAPGAWWNCSTDPTDRPQRPQGAHLLCRLSPRTGRMQCSAQTASQWAELGPSDGGSSK